MASLSERVMVHLLLAQMLTQTGKYPEATKVGLATPTHTPSNVCIPTGTHPGLAHALVTMMRM